MAVTESTLVVGPLVPDEGVTTISLDFFFERAEWLEVYRGASDEPLTLSTDYTVSGEGTSQGSITLSEPADGDTPYAVYLVVPLERDSDLSPRADLRSRTVNQELDRVVQGAQGVRALAERGLRVSRTSPVPGVVHAPDVGERGTRLLRFSEDGERLELGVPEPDVAQLQEDVQRAADAAEAAEQSETRAGEWAENPEDDPVVQFNGNELFSAKHHAAKAAQSAALSNRVIYVDTIADLQALNTDPLPDGQQVSVTDQATGGVYRYDESASSGGIAPDSGGGRWLLVRANAQAITFNNVQQMKDFASLYEGANVRTLGYYAPGDGGGNYYEIVEAGTGTDDGGSFIDLAGSGLQARGLFSLKANVVQFGADPTGLLDSAAAIQAAANWGVLRGLPGNIYRVDSEILLTEDLGEIVADFRGVTFDCTNMREGEGFGDVVFARISGSVESTVDMAASVARQDTAIEVLDSTGFSPGDRVFISSNERYKDGYTEGPRRGEIRTVESASAGMINLTTPVFFSYDASDLGRVRKINPVKVIWQGGTVLMGGAESAHRGFDVRYCAESKFTEFTVIDAEERGIDLSYCNDVLVMPDRIWNCTSASNSGGLFTGTSGCGVGVSNASRNVVIDGGWYKNNRHSISATGSGGGSIATLECVAMNIHSEDSGIGTQDLDTHPANFLFEYRNCVVTVGGDSSKSGGVQIRGQGNKVKNVKILGANAQALHVVSSSVDPSGIEGFTAEDVEIYNSGSGGIILDSGNGTVKDVTISNVKTRDINFSHLTCEGTLNVTVTGLNASDTSGSFRIISITGSQNVQVSGVVRGGERSARIRDSSGVSVSGDFYPAAGNAAIDASGSQDVYVRFGHIETADTNAIELVDCSDVIVSGGLVSGNSSSFSRFVQATDCTDLSVYGAVVRDFINAVRAFTDTGSTDNIIISGVNARRTSDQAFRVEEATTTALAGNIE